MDDGDRIDVVWCDRSLEEISIRIDVRRLSFAFLESVVEIATRHGLILLLEDGRAINPEVGELLEVIKISAASRFVADPIAFLRSIDQKMKSN
jgi:hypothetical protein